MSIVFRVPGSAADRVAFCYSPLMEAVLSLHVLLRGTGFLLLATGTLLIVDGIRTIG